MYQTAKLFDWKSGNESRAGSGSHAVAEHALWRAIYSGKVTGGETNWQHWTD